MDVEAEDDTSDIWTDEASDIKLALKSNTIAIGTFRNVDVPLEVEVLEKEPTVDLDDWDHASLGFFSIFSGKCSVSGCTDYLPDAAQIGLSPGIYSVLSLAKGLDSIAEHWEDANDLYKVFLWTSNSSEYKLLKSYEKT